MNDTYSVIPTLHKLGTLEDYLMNELYNINSLRLDSSFTIDHSSITTSNPNKVFKLSLDDEGSDKRIDEDTPIVDSKFVDVINMDEVLDILSNTHDVYVLIGDEFIHKSRNELFIYLDRSVILNNIWIFNYINKGIVLINIDKYIDLPLFNKVLNENENILSLKEFISNILKDKLKLDE